MTFIYTAFISPIELLIEVLFVFFQKVFRNYGVSIIAISMAVSFLTLPLYHKADSLQQKERKQREKLQGRIDRIKETFKGDEQYMMLTTLYRQNHYHPLYALRSSLGLFIQIPFFIAAYHFLSHLSVLDGQSFSIIKNLHEPDGLLKIGALSINVLPILMTVVNILAGAVYTKGFVLRDKIQLFLMAGLFLVLLYTSPAGLVLYWTFNNIFSLVKNVVYKAKHPGRILYCVIVFAVLGLITTVFIFKPTMKPLNRVILIGLGVFAIGLPGVMKIGTKLFDNKMSHIYCSDQTMKTLFFLSLLFMFVLIGIIVPANTILSSPIEFSNIGMVSNPLHYILYSAAFFFGLIIVWPSLLYLISPMRLKAIFSILSVALAISALSNIFVFKGRYGDINNMFIFENIDLIAPNLRMILLPIVIGVLLIALILVLVQQQRTRIIVVLLALLTVSSVINAAMTIIQISNEYKIYASNVEDTRIAGTANYEITPLLPLSRVNENVVVLLLDRAISAYFPMILDQFPDLIDVYSGFDYYPNTLSFGWNTLSGSPPLMGGYEYTPDAFNERKNEKLVDKHNEATLVLPLAFQDIGLRASVFNPPLANYKWSNDFSAFEPYPDINVYATKGAFTKKYEVENLDTSGIKANFGNLLIEKRIPMYVLFKSLPPLVRPLLYDKGTYYLMYSDNTLMNQDLLEFLDDYSELYYLPELTQIDDGPGSYVFFANETPHRPLYLQAPNYIPIPDPTDITNPLQHDRLSKTLEQIHYHANAATILQVGKWLQYLKDEDVYDNTRIIIVADHGYFLMVEDFKNFPEKGVNYAKYNPLLAVKDFDAQGTIKTLDTFMTNADVPLIALQGFVDKPINPLTNKLMHEYVDKEQVNVYNISNHGQDNQGYQYQFKSDHNFIVTENIFLEENWRENKNF